MKTVMNNIIEKVIDETVNGFIDVVSNKYGISKDELRRVWTNNHQPSSSTTESHERLPAVAAVVQEQPKPVV